MSTLKDLTRNSVQSGLSAAKWLSLCKLFISKNRPPQDVDIGSELSKSVLVLFSDYPGDPTLQAYLKRALQDGMIQLSSFVQTFLAAAKSPSMHNSSTLDMLCRIALDCHYSAGLSPIGSVVSFTEAPIIVFETAHLALSLLKTAFQLPSTHFHQFTASASELLLLLLSCVNNDFTQLNTNQAVTRFAEDAGDLLSQPSLSPDVKHVLEQFILSISYLLGEDVKAAREAQMIHSTLGRSHAVVPNSDSDIVSCSLLLRSLVVRRVSEFGAGDSKHAVVLFIALVRSASWTPTAFYTQLLLAAVTCVAQEANNGVSTKASLLWKAFVIGRLPHLISMFAQTVELEGVTASDWRQAMSAALASLLQEEDILAKCDLLYHSSESSSQPTVSSHPFIGELLHQLLVTGVIDQAFASTLRNNLSLSELHPRIQSEAQEHAPDVETYIESKLGVDQSIDDLSSLFDKIWQDSCSHAVFAELVNKRFRSCVSALDIESLGHLCEILYVHEHALDILSLHVKFSDLVAQALIILEDYDCETVGDPQTAVSHLGNIVLFSQTALSRYYLSTTMLEYGGRRPNLTMLTSAVAVYRMEELSNEDAAAFSAWHKALFDSGSEGIEDTILRSTRPKTLLRIAATLVSHAITMSQESKLDKDVLNNGISYFLGPLLNWTLVGVIKTLLLEIQHKSPSLVVQPQVEVLQTLLQSTSCPKQVLRLTAAATLRSLSETTTGTERHVYPFDTMPLRQVAMQAMGLPVEEAAIPFSLEGRSLDVADFVKHAIQESFTSARAKKAPSLDVDRCLLMVSPARFLSMLWAELMVVSAMGQLNICRRIATYVLSTPRSSRSPPLLPIFLHLTLPNIMESADHLLAAEQAIAAELLAVVISSALTSALYVEWALQSVCKEKRLVLGQTALAMARRLSGDLRRKGHSPVSGGVVQRLVSNTQFMSNFPTFTGDM